MKQLKVKVLARHIKKGVPESETCCPIALAIKEKTHRKVNVCPFDVIVGKTVYGLPKEACVFIDRFDRDWKVKPFTFVASTDELYIPCLT